VSSEPYTGHSKANDNCSEDGKSTRSEFGGWSEIRDGFAIPKGKRRREGERDRKERKGRSEAAGTRGKRGTSCYSPMFLAKAR